MKDLYRRIGISVPTNDRETIKRAVVSGSKANPTDGRHAWEIFRDPARKAAYDRSWQVLSIVGQARANLGLSRTSQWLATDCGDFDRPPSQGGSELSMLRNAHQAHAGMRSGRQKYDFKGVLVTLFVVLAMCIGGTMIEKWMSSRPQPTRTPTRTSPPPQTSSQTMQTLTPRPAATKSREELARIAETQRVDAIKAFVVAKLAKSGREVSPTDTDKYVQLLTARTTLATPVTGVLTRLHKTPAVAPLEIKTQVGSNYYVRIVTWDSKQPVLTAFIRGGERFSIEVPLGNYEIRYASGNEWYGELLDFGTGASYARCDEVFSFAIDGSQYSGYTLELILQTNGNLETDPIGVEDF